ncbi:hypothetical protein PT286_01865 [Neisseriaceae bacterium ESL0693]|nr:hypothetical protein [Neisseriaceae bacterium ESL0693]
MRSHKLMLLGVLSVLYIPFSCAEIVRISQFIYTGKDAGLIREVCRDKYTDQDIHMLKKLASKGDDEALLKLGIFYDMKSIQLYQQVEKNNDASVAALLKTRHYPCTYILHNEYFQ